MHARKNAAAVLTAIVLAGFASAGEFALPPGGSPRGTEWAAPLPYLNWGVVGQQARQVDSMLPAVDGASNAAAIVDFLVPPLNLKSRLLGSPRPPPPPETEFLIDAMYRHRDALEALAGNQEVDRLSPEIRGAVRDLSQLLLKLDARPLLRRSLLDHLAPTAASLAGASESPLLSMRLLNNFFDGERGRMALSPEEVATPASAGRAISGLLKDPELESMLSSPSDSVSRNDSPHAELSSLALLIDAGLSAPDYGLMSQGYQYPRSRQAYRRRDYAGVVRYFSESRQERERAIFQEQIRSAVAAPEPAAALRRLLSRAFLGEIGVSPADSVDWKISIPALHDLIRREALIPLRALNETVEGMAPKFPHVRPQLKAVILEITRHMLEGDFRDWRYGNPQSRVQLAALDDARRGLWREGLNLEQETSRGTKLLTREEDDVDLLWTTKIGGPSHGFDHGGHSLLPLLANARTKAILVDDERWPYHAAARAYLRLLSFEDGKPVLYLEPMQRDFPHRSRFRSFDENRDFARAILFHAVSKARLMGLPLSIDQFELGLARQMGLDPRPSLEGYVLEPSAGVFEASDTLGRDHDWVQTERQVSPSLGRALIDP